MNDTTAGNGKAVVNRAMSLDGFIAGPGDAMKWIFDFMAPDASDPADMLLTDDIGEAVATAQRCRRQEPGDPRH